MNESEVIRSILEALDEVEVAEVAGDSFFFYDPDPAHPADRKLPFATLVTTDAHDRASDLDRSGVFRLNIGVRPETYRAMFGDPPPWTGDGSVVATGHDFTRLDEILPHPVYAAMSWICVLSPSEATFERIRPLLAEAHATAVRRYEAKEKRS